MKDDWEQMCMIRSLVSGNVMRRLCSEESGPCAAMFVVCSVFWEIADWVYIIFSVLIKSYSVIL